MASFKLTKLERNWIFYDVGNSAFTLLITTIMPIYFNSQNCHWCWRKTAKTAMPK